MITPAGTVRFEAVHQPRYRVVAPWDVLGEVMQVGGAWMAFRPNGSMVSNGERSEWPSRREAANALLLHGDDR